MKRTLYAFTSFSCLFFFSLTTSAQEAPGENLTKKTSGLFTYSVGFEQAKIDKLNPLLFQNPDNYFQNHFATINLSSGIVISNKAYIGLNIGAQLPKEKKEGAKTTSLAGTRLMLEAAYPIIDLSKIKISPLVKFGASTFALTVSEPVTVSSLGGLLQTKSTIVAHNFNGIYYGGIAAEYFLGRSEDECDKHERYIGLRLGYQDSFQNEWLAGEANLQGPALAAEGLQAEITLGLRFK